MMSYCIVLLMIVFLSTRSIKYFPDYRYHIRKFPEDLYGCSWIPTISGNVHLPDLTEFVILWKNTSKKHRLKLLKDREAMVEVIQEVC